MKEVRSWLFLLSLAFTVLVALSGCRKVEGEKNGIITV